MVDTGVFATTSEVQLWVPDWASATYNAEAYINEFIGCFEADINNNEQFVNLSDSYSTNNRDLKLTAHKMVCLQCAMAICQMDPSGTDIRTAEFFFDWADTEIKRCITLLTKKEIIKNIGDSS